MDEKKLGYDYIVKNKQVWEITEKEYKKLSFAKSLFISSNVKQIKIFDSALSLSSNKLSLEKIDIDENNQFFYSNGSNAIIEKQNQSLILGCKNTIIPNGVKSISEDAFCKCEIKEVRIPDSVLEINHGAFRNCDKLEKIEIGKNVKYIGRLAFCSCYSLKYIKIPSNVNEIGREAFKNCLNLKEVIIENGVKLISMSAFFRCSSLEKIKIPGSVNEIKFEAFRLCSNLKEVVIDNGVERIENLAFSGCTSLTKIKIPNSVTQIGINSLSLSCYIDEDLEKRFPFLKKEEVQNSNEQADEFEFIEDDEKGESVLSDYDLFCYHIK